MIPALFVLGIVWGVVMFFVMMVVAKEMAEADS